MPHATEIKVWTVALIGDTHADWRKLDVLLSRCERDRACRFVFERNRRAYVVAHALKRIMLSAIAATPPQSLNFEVDPGGKPRVQSEIKTAIQYHS